MAKCCQLLEIRGDDKDCDSLCGELANESVEVGLTHGVDPLGRFVQDENSQGIANQASGHNNLLLIAARELPHLLFRACGLNGEPFDAAKGLFSLASPR